MAPLVAFIAVVALGSPTSASAQPASPGRLQITWLGHAAFEVVSPKGTKVLIDPFLQGNPKTPAAWQDLKRHHPDVILVTHSHGDHVGQAAAIAKQSKAQVVASAHLVRSMAIPDAQKAAANVGGKLTFDDVTVHLVPAMHGSSPGGRPVGFVLTFAGSKERIYHSGDTWIFSDMALIHEIHQPTILLLQAGGGPFNQDPSVAALAVKKYFRPRHIIPMHFGTWPVLEGEAAVRQAFAGDKRLLLLTPGVPHSF